MRNDLPIVGLVLLTVLFYGDVGGAMETEKLLLVAGHGAALNVRHQTLLAQRHGRALDPEPQLARHVFNGEVIA